MDPTIGLVVAAAVGAIGTTTAAVLGPIANRRWLEKNVGKANGQGNVIQMQEATVLWCETHQSQDDERHKALQEGQEWLAQAVKDLQAQRNESAN